MIVCVTSARSVGCTFLEWSINWLSGQLQYFVAAENRSIPLTHAPLASHDYTKTTAHNHRKNHPRGIVEVERTLESFNNHPNSFKSFYPIANEVDHWCKELELDLGAMTNQHWQSVVQAQQHELNSIGKLCQAQNVKMVHVTESNFAIPYFVCTRLIPPWANNKTQNEIDYYKILVNMKNVTLPVWDLRELLALNLRPLAPNPYTNYIDQTQPHYTLTVEDLWFDAKHCIPKVLDWLDLKLDNARLLAWQNVYNSWQKTQLEYVRMCWQLPVIVDAIVNNYYLPLPKLSLIWEVVIQHCLIYQHNLNLRNWQLEKFPNNAKDLHALLEPNTHKIT